MAMSRNLRRIVKRFFRRVGIVDFEYECFPPGSLYRPLCMVAYELDEHLRLVRIHRLWRGEFGKEPPFPTDDDTLIVAYAAHAEMQCFQALGWKFPVHVFDQFVAYAAATNFLFPKTHGGLRPKVSRKLSDACRVYGIGGWENIDKPQLAKDIGEGRWQLHGRQVCSNYCEEDVKNSAELFRRQLRGSTVAGFAPINVELVLHWSEYCGKAVALTQSKGMFIDVPLWTLVQENEQAIIRHLIRRFDPSQGSANPIFNDDGEWSNERFAKYLIEHRIPWPRHESGALDLSKDAFELMEYVPGIEGLYALRKILRTISTANLPIGPDNINRPSLFPFGTLTGRNAHGKSLFNTHAALRSFIKPSPGKILVYLDWRTQEIGYAAYKSGDEKLQAAYRRGDIYHSFALELHLTAERDQKIFKSREPVLRQRMKSLVLGINYGMGVRTIARKLERHPVIANGWLEHHRRTYAQFWQHREDQMWQAMLSRHMEAEDGWPLHLLESPHRRTIYNFPCQSGGAAMLRSTAVRLCEAGLIPSMLVHDGILLELDHHEQIEQARTIMRDTGTEVCGGFVIDVDIDQIREHGEPYRDKRPMAVNMWNAILDVLKAVGALAA
jgi:DNA polymerase-1